jgi:hypothetical protein
VRLSFKESRMQFDNATNLDRKSGTWDDNDLFPLLSQKGATAPASGRNGGGFAPAFSSHVR